MRTVTFLLLAILIYDLRFLIYGIKNFSWAASLEAVLSF
jgi:hypothetical protein